MTQNPINPEVFEDLQDAMGDEFAEELLLTFLSEAPGMLADLRSAAAEGDTERLRRAAHSIKSNAQTFGAEALSSLARDIELVGLAADPKQASQQMDALEAAFRTSDVALRALNDG